ncbi:DUF421 domain-containing protein [Paenibacillus sacheonensis]|uniref:DUF421 domain-containing protein n=1 Tax=Paenibacillus sacheonensis TaxID=742054 RepID=A0A7X4YK67_9BACL|nr:DUF421 domain-containing protein [Paenibacillus sacheonensis]MBM7563744.1 uncharacterized membrane protein YcaP (DUF421 family) [Paenibacillus sacheonensis]NBC67901.1 DUF421 domain-containing protein [Paenibacillus sacheonensis]
MEYWTLLFRTLLIYFVVFLIMRMMGKREIGKLSVFDLVISVMIAEIAVFVIEDTDRPIMDGILPMVILLVIQIGIALLSLRSRRMRTLFDGEPAVIVDRGKINRDAMRKQRYNLDDLLLQFRENKTNIADVEFAILETTGKLSIVQKDKGESQENSDDRDSQDENQAGNRNTQSESQSRNNGSRLHKTFPRNYRFENLPVPLIMDGEIQKHNLEKLEKDRFWLNNQLKQRGIVDAKQVFLCTIDHRGELFIDIKHRKGPYNR